MLQVPHIKRPILYTDDEQEGPDAGIPTPSKNIQDISLSAFQNEDPLEALRLFWQPDKNTNHRLVLPLHPRADLLKEQHVTHTYYLDYFLAIGKSVGMDLIAIEPDVEGESACHAPSTLHPSCKRPLRIIIYFPPQSFLSICS